MSRVSLWIFALILAVVAFPSQWYPESVRLLLSGWFGADSYRSLPVSKDPASLDSSESFCPADPKGWRQSWQIEGVDIEASAPCVADNPHAVAAFVRGSNNVSQDTLQKSGLTIDAVEKGRDLDGDGDPDEIHIRLEVVELNGSSTEQRQPVTQYALAPGIKPGLWVFAPKLAGMARENFESRNARAQLRLPSPAIRIEQGDRVTVTLENTHYMPHTLHLHGSDHSFVTAEGEGNDGVPLTSEKPVLPGGSRSYQLSPRRAGTSFYHCHVQPHVHVQMGLQGLFVVEENRPNNWLQTMNLGAGQVRVPSKAVREIYDSEYDLHYLDLDKQLSERIQDENDPRLITKSMHRDYDVTDATSDYFTLNGRSFPYTFRESLIVVEPDQRIKLRVVNGGAKGLSLHTHGHKFTVTDRDGVALSPAMRTQQDVVWLATAQRVDLELNTSNDGLNSYGPGIWPFHDHQSRGITTDGIGPGGNISAIVYPQYIDQLGWPKTQGNSWQPYFTEAYYRKEIPIWESYAPGLFSDPDNDWLILLRILALALSVGIVAGLLSSWLLAKVKSDGGR